MIGHHSIRLGFQALRWLLFSLLLIFLQSILLPASFAIQAESTNPFQREIFVPFESLDILLDGNSNRALLTRDEYKKLLESARVEEIKRAPIDGAIVSARYVGTISDGVARIRGELIVEPLNEGLVQIPLPFSGVAIRSARLGDQGAKLWRDSNGQIVLLTSGTERETLVLDLTLPMQTSAARQTMAFQVPVPASTEFKLTVPGNVEIKSGAAIVSRDYREGDNATEFDFLATQEPMSIIMSLNNRLLKDDQVVVSRSVVVHKLTSHRQEMHVTCSLDVLHGAIEEVAFAVPPGFEVAAVATELLSSWEVKEANEGTSNQLQIKLRAPTREAVVLNIAAIKNEPAIGDWIATEIRPVDIAGQVTVVGVLADINLASANLSSTGVIPIDHQFLLSAIPSSLAAAQTDSAVKVIAAFYAPQAEYKIAVSFSAPEPELIVKSSSRLVIDNQQLELQGGLSLVSKHDSRFDFKLKMPPGWRLNDLSNQDGTALRYDRLDSVADGDGADFLVRLPHRIASDNATRVFFNASYTPAEWLEKWDSRTIEFPNVEIEQQTKHTGVIAIATDEDLLIQPQADSELEILDEEDKKQFEFDRQNAPLAYRFNDSSYKLTLDLERLQPSITGRSYNFYTIKPNELVVHTELIYDVKLAESGEFQFELPLNSPASISILAAGKRLKDFRSETIGSVKRWTVQLAKPAKGSVQLLVNYVIQLDDEQRSEMNLTPVKMNGVTFQSAMMAIEGSNELDIDIDTKSRLVDVGELTEAKYQPGRYLLGAFSAANENMELKVSSVRRPVFELPAAIAQRAEMVTSISNLGRSQTAARFQLVTKQQPFLRIELPPDSTLWSVQLDGQPAKPQRNGDSLLVSLIDGDSARVRDLQMVYESRVDSFGFIGQIEAQAPTLWLGDSDDSTAMPVPLVDLQWRLLMPDGFSVTYSGGEFQSNQLVRQTSPIEQLVNWLVRLGGGFGHRNQLVREAAAVKSPNVFRLTQNDLSSAAESGAEFSKPTNESQKTVQLPPTARPMSRDKDMLPGQGLAGELGELADERRKTAIAEKQALDWALSGLRSLNIELTETGNSIEFFSLGEQSTLRATVVNQSRMNWIAISIALLIAALGVLLTHGKLKAKAFFLLLILVFVGCLPLLGSTFDLFRTLIDLAILSVVFVAIYFVVIAIAQLFFRSIGLVATRVAVLMLLTLMLTGTGQNIFAQEVVNDTNELKRLIAALQSDEAVTLPTDAVIIPFDANDPDGRVKADRMLLPYEYYLKLLAAAKADQAPDSNPLEPLNSPVDFVISSVDYSVQLSLEDNIVIVGKLLIDVLTEEAISVAFPMSGGALANATVDGSPAKLMFEEVPRTTKSKSPPIPMTILHLSGRGTKTFEFTYRCKPQRAGGWRILNANLPVGITRGLNLKTVADATEIRLNNDGDNRAIEAKANEEIASVLGADGGLRIQWKPSTARQTIDQSLTAQSEAMFDVREDGLRLSWLVDLDFRGSERDTFTMQIPAGFLVEQIQGDNIRAWDSRKIGGNGNANQQGTTELNVTLLSPAKDRESFTIELSRRDFSVTENAVGFDVPFLSVAGAALHKGEYTIRRSPIIQLKTTSLMGANRADDGAFKSRMDLKSIDSKTSPLGIEPFQTFQFITTPFRIGIQANLEPVRLAATTQTILRIGQTEANLEARIKLDVGDRAIYELSLDLPADAEIHSLSTGLNENWSSDILDGVQRVQLYFPAGITDDFSILLAAELTEFAGGDQLSIPKLKVNNVESQSGEIVIQVDPAISVSASDLQNCETVLLQQVESWLNPEQRSNTRLAIRAKNSDYSAQLKFTKIEPRVTVETVTNVRTTLFAIEETILLDFDIQQAGIRKIQFDIPATMKNANIVAKLVSEKRIEPVPENSALVRVTLNLQDDVIDSYRVVIENDRQLSDIPQPVPMARVLTGTTEGQFVTLQNAGRDEISVLPSNDVVPLNRQLNQFAKLKQKLAGGELTMAYVVDSKSESTQFEYVTVQRESFDTVAASIEFSKTTMVVDSSGAYRALQNFQINNRSEQYLEIELPAGARLLTVVVGDQPVKPVAWPSAKNDRRLRIPLVKTPLGDLDYSVQLKYAGQLGDLNNLQNVSFPVIETLNINVQLSQLHLRLPESHQWLNFDGTMTKVDGRGELEESYLGYKARQIQQLAEQLQSETSSFGSSFSKSRALKNLKKLETEIAGYASDNGLDSGASESKVQELLLFNGTAIQQAQQRYSAEVAQSGKGQQDNRDNFNELVQNQKAKIARNSVTRGGQNFFQESPSLLVDALDASQQQMETGNPFGEPNSNINTNGRAAGTKSAGQQAGGKFDQTWLQRNNLEMQQGGGQSESQSEERFRHQASLSGKPMAGEDLYDQAGQQGAADLGVVVSQSQSFDDSISFSNSTKELAADAKQKSREYWGSEQDRIHVSESEWAGGMGFADREMKGMDGGVMGMGGMGGGRVGGGFGGGGTGDGEMDEESVRRSVTGEAVAEVDFASGGYGGKMGSADGLFDANESLPQDRPTSGPDGFARSVNKEISAAALTSLDIELPSRGVDYFFKSPRGNAEVSARPVATRSFNRLMGALAMFGVCVGGWLICLVAGRVQRSNLLRGVAITAMLIGGLISLGSATLPVYGLIAVAAGIVAMLHWAGTSMLPSRSLPA